LNLRDPVSLFSDFDPLAVLTQVFGDQAKVWDFGLSE